MKLNLSEDDFKSVLYHLGCQQDSYLRQRNIAYLQEYAQSQREIGNKIAVGSAIGKKRATVIAAKNSIEQYDEILILRPVIKTLDFE